MVVGAAVAGLVGEDTAFLWGGLTGCAVAAVLWWRGLLATWGDGALLVVAFGAGFALVDVVLDGRAGPVSLAESLATAPGWLVAGAGLAFVLWRRDRALGWAVVPAALAWAAAGVLVLQWGEGIGYLEELGNRAIEAGETQPLDAAFFAWAGGLVTLLGAGAGLALYVGSPALVAVGVAAVATLFSANKIGFSFVEIVNQFDRLGELAREFWPPQWTWPDVLGAPDELQILDPMIETIQIAIVGATLGCLIALPVAFLASRPTSYNGPVYWVARTVMNVLRTIPDLFWGIFFATAVGFGRPFAGALAMVMFSMTIMAKLLSETVDTIDLGPLEAARAAGSRHSQVVNYAAFPQVWPNYVAYALYIFELNIRASVVIGLVGAGGIGLLLNEQRSFFQFDRVMAIVIVIFVAVMLIELVSVTIRKRIV